jgi:hypothetical protein
MNSIINSDWFQIFGVTLLSLGLGVFIKYVTGNDKHKDFKKEDLAIGLDMMLTGLILLITDTVNDFNRLSNPDLTQEVKILVQDSLQVVPWMILMFAMGLWGISTVIRKIGWQNEDELHSWWGITFPNIIGITALILVFTWVRN